MKVGGLNVAVPVLFKFRGANGGIAELSVSHSGTVGRTNFRLYWPIDETNWDTSEYFDLGTMGECCWRCR